MSFGALKIIVSFYLELNVVLQWMDCNFLILSSKYIKLSLPFIILDFVPFAINKFMKIKLRHVIRGDKRMALMDLDWLLLDELLLSSLSIYSLMSNFK